MLDIPKNFQFAGVSCGIKASGNNDVSLFVTHSEATVAGVFTQNRFCAAPVTLCKERLSQGLANAVVVNSGNANACTGDEGLANANAMVNQVAGLLHVDASRVYVMSTGIIGQQLPMEKVATGIGAAYLQLDDGHDAFSDSVEGIMTTDKFPKCTSQNLVFVKHEGEARLIAMAKGAGMIAPNMATMLGLFLTDVAIAADHLQQLLSEVCKESFNKISVDGHTSTNDTVLMLANGASGITLTPGTEEWTMFRNSLCESAISLAKSICRDGEGATHVLDIHASGLVSESDADKIVHAVAESPLVKTAITGNDPNWGRIVSAAGYAGVNFDAAKVSLAILGTTIFQDGAPIPFDAAALSGRMQDNEEVLIELTFGEGESASNCWASDLTTEYVEFNSEYTT